MGTMDLNADLGESFGAWTLGDDARLVEHLTSANLACGFHAGDFRVMEATVALCHDAGVAVGAQPGYPDLLGFGRRAMPFEPAEVESLVRYQIGALEAFCRAAGVEMQHVKPHGALYNMAAADAGLAAAIARAVLAFDASLILFGLPGSALLEAGRAAGLRVATEAFADRAYQRDGTLAPRSIPGAVISEPSAVVSRAIRMVSEGVVTAIDGTDVQVAADTLCVHGDTPGAGQLAASVRSGLEAAGITVAAIADGRA
jgi:5-oxoprolinase (ATP-hydrolysing) subunit A